MTPVKYVAAAIVKVLDKPKTQASVPGWSRSIGIMTLMLSARSRRWLGKKMGTDTVFRGREPATQPGNNPEMGCESRDH